MLEGCENVDFILYIICSFHVLTCGWRGYQFYIGEYLSECPALPSSMEVAR